MLTSLTIIIVFSVIFQLSAALYALWLIRITGLKYSWILISIALFLMCTRRLMSLYYILLNISYPFELTSELIGLSLSFLMLLGVYGIGSIFTERKLIEEKLQKEQAFRTSIEKSFGSGIAVVDKVGLQSYVNPSFCKMVDWTKEELTGQAAPFVYWPSEHFQAINEAFQITIDGKASKEGFELVFMRKDSSRFPVQIIISPLNDGKQNIGWLANVLDISERKQTEEALRKSEESFYAIFENNSAPIAIIEPDSTISMVNEEYCIATGYTKQEVIGTSWKQQIAPEDLERLKENNRRRLINPDDAPKKYEFSVIKKNGEKNHIIASAKLLKNKQLVLSFIDITERKLAEEKIKSLLADKEVILTEVNHRIKNNMNTIYSLLLLQADTMKDPLAIAAL